MASLSDAKGLEVGPVRIKSEQTVAESWASHAIWAGTTTALSSAPGPVSCTCWLHCEFAVLREHKKIGKVSGWKMHARFLGDGNMQK